MESNPKGNESPASKLFINVVSVIGLCVFACALGEVATTRFNMEWLLLGLVTVLVVARTDIQIPKISSTVTLEDAFIYIAVLLYGVGPAVMVAGVSAAVCSLHYPNRRKVIPFNTGVMSLSVFISATVATNVFGSARELGPDLVRLILAAEVLALIHYVLNSGLVSVVSALRNKKDILKTWQESFLWTSVSYFAGAVAACFVIKLITIISFYSFIIAVPIFAITYLTYKNYLDRA